MFTDVHDRLIAITGVGREGHVGETAAKNEALSLMLTVALDEPHGVQRGRHGGPGRLRGAGERGGCGGVSGESAGAERERAGARASLTIGCRRRV